MFFGKLFSESIFFVAVTQHEITVNKSCYCEGTDHMACFLKKRKKEKRQASIKHILYGHGGCIQRVCAAADFCLVEQSYLLFSQYPVTCKSKFTTPPPLFF